LSGIFDSEKLKKCTGITEMSVRVSPKSALHFAPKWVVHFISKSSSTELKKTKILQKQEHIKRGSVSDEISGTFCDFLPVLVGSMV